MKKIIVDCSQKSIQETIFTTEEMLKYESDIATWEEQKLLDNLVPDDKEMLMAEVEIQTITILMEVGLI